ncbi:MAG: PHP-associated domain-containing protein [Candidatus Hodarchaeales archaeon]|jgi:predicted metal-dependent phosphoesterase TrpH
MLIDLHVHTSNGSNDSRLTLNKIAMLYSRVDAVVVTDHDYLPKKIKQREIKGLLVFFGTEITTLQGHVLAYGIQDLPSINLDVKEVIDQIHEQGGIAIAAHPFRSYYALGEIVLDPEIQIDGLEINGNSSKSENRETRKAAKMRELPLTGGSDAHRSKELNTILTRFREPVECLDDIVQQVKRKTISPRVLFSRRY